MDWVDKREAERKEQGAEGYFNIVEGDNKIQLLTHVAPHAQVFDPATKKYRPAEEGDTNVSVKGICWVLHEGKIKQAKLPYTVVKSIRELQNDEDYAFSEFPMPRIINIKAKGAGTKEVEYTVVPSPKETKVSDEILAELEGKPTPEEIVEKIKGVSQRKTAKEEDSIDPESIPF